MGQSKSTGRLLAIDGKAAFSTYRRNRRAQARGDWGKIKNKGLDRILAGHRAPVCRTALISQRFRRRSPPFEVHTVRIRSRKLIKARIASTLLSSEFTTDTIRLKMVPLLGSGM
jgi:hypothetical protein